MKVICQRVALLEAISVAGLVVPTRSPKPVLQCLKLTAGDDKLTIDATDLELAVKFVDAAVQVESPGATLVPADRLRDIVRESSDDTIALSVEGNEMHLRGADSHYKIFTQNAGEFPPVPGSDAEPQIEIAAGTLKQMINQTLFATSKEGTRYAFNGVLFVIENKILALVATDGRRLALSRGDVIRSNNPSKSKPIVPARSLGLVEKLLDDPEATVSISLSDNQAVFSVPDARLTTNLLEGQFPQYEEVIPKDADKRMVANTADFLSAVRRASLLTSDNTKGVRMDFSKAKGVVLSSRDPEAGEAKIEFACKFEGADLAMGFNPSFLVDALKIVNADEVSLDLTHAGRPGLIKAGTSFMYVIMPVNLQ
jgi:DNA polymerase-3 subunit beta